MTVLSRNLPLSSTLQSSRRIHTLFQQNGQCIISNAVNPYLNLAFEEWLLRNSPPDNYILFMYRNRPCVVIGRNQNPWKECNFKLMKDKDVLLARRQSGGGAVFHDLGNTNYSIILPRQKFDRKSSAELVARALQTLGIQAYVNGRNDIYFSDKKISGSAYKVIKDKAYHHGTMLLGSNLTHLSGCLQTPHTDIISKGVESVSSPVLNLRDISSRLDHDVFCQAVIEEFRKAFPPARQQVFDSPQLESISQVYQNYHHLQSWDWIFGQTPEFSLSLKKDFSWSSVQVFIQANKGRFTNIKVQTSQKELECQLSEYLSKLMGLKYNAISVLKISEHSENLTIGTLATEELNSWLFSTL